MPKMALFGKFWGSKNFGELRGSLEKKLASYLALQPDLLPPGGEGPLGFPLAKFGEAAVKPPPRESVNKLFQILFCLLT